MKNKSILFTLVFLCILTLFYFYKSELFSVPTSTQSNDTEVYTLIFPSERFPETAAHIKLAIDHGEPSACTIDRKGAEENRKESLKGIPTKPNLDRDEFPMAMCAEGGTGADIMYIIEVLVLG